MRAKSLHLMRLCLIQTLFLALIIVPARADDRDRLFAARAISPAGVIYSFGALTINGRFSRGGQMIWNGDLLQLSAEASARLALDLIGEVTLDQKTTVRISTNPADAKRRVLIASIICGSVEVKLSSDAEAYIEAAGSIFAASTGSSFRAGIREGRPFIDSLSGNVEAHSQIESRLTLSLESASPPLRQVAVRSFKVKKKAKPKFVFQGYKDRLSISRNLAYASATKSPSGLPELAPENAANRKVRFRLENPIGLLDGQPNEIIKTTDQNGKVEVEFTALSQGRSKFIAEFIDIDPLKEISLPWEGDIEVEPSPFPIKKLLIGAIGAAIVVAILTRRDSKDSGLIKGPINVEPGK